jgi:hypothetical protein
MEAEETAGDRQRFSKYVHAATNTHNNKELLDLVFYIIVIIIIIWAANIK